MSSVCDSVINQNFCADQSQRLIWAQQAYIFGACSQLHHWWQAFTSVQTHCTGGPGLDLRVHKQQGWVIYLNSQSTYYYQDHSLIALIAYRDHLPEVSAIVLKGYHSILQQLAIKSGKNTHMCKATVATDQVRLAKSWQHHMCSGLYSI